MSEASQHIRGILEPLPAGEQVLWQGAPSGWAMGRLVFRIPLLAIYFTVILACRAAWSLVEGNSIEQALIAALWLLPLALTGMGMLAVIAWLMARTTIYAITSRRVVMRIGIALPMTFNIPFRTIESAGLKTYTEGVGDIPLKLLGTDRIAYLQLWPHARPWRFNHTEPMLRAVPNAAQVGMILSRALTEFTGGATSWQAPETIPASMKEARSLAASAR